MYNIEGGIWILNNIENPENKKILEFGNQHIWEHAKSFLNTNHNIACDWFLDELKAKQYICIDTNKQDNALDLDLTKKLPEYLHNQFDIVTNIGTSEHCGNDIKKQWIVFFNAVYTCKVGGMILHNIPPEHMWLDHCDIWYRDGLGQVLADSFGCKLIKEERITLYRLNPDADYLAIKLIKEKDIVEIKEPIKEFKDCIAL